MGPGVPCSSSLPAILASPLFPEVPLSGTETLLNKQWPRQLRSHLSHWLPYNLRSPSCHSWDSMSSLFTSLVEMAPHTWQDWGLRSRLPQARHWAG